MFLNNFYKTIEIIMQIVKSINVAAVTKGSHYINHHYPSDPCDIFDQSLILNIQRNTEQIKRS